jgi:hypothetical protein
LGNCGIACSLRDDSYDEEFDEEEDILRLITCYELRVIRLRGFTLVDDN